MTITENLDLAAHSTMRTGGRAAYGAVITTDEELVDALAWATKQNLPIIMIGGGSNILWRDEDFAGVVLVNRITGYVASEDTTTITIGAGENWDSVVARTVDAGLTGIECMSLIPGNAGATPIQNVGAYGQEIAHTLVSVRAFDMQAQDFVTIPAAECGFGYRMSRFKSTDRGRFYITHITLQLRKGNPEPPFYPAVQAKLDLRSTEATPATVRAAVIEIRSAKLPDPTLVGNNGSFFANPVVSQHQLEAIQAKTDGEVPHWPVQEGLIKLSAAWLIQEAGFKDYHDAATGMATWPTQPLVLVNETARSTSDVIAFRDKIVAAVQAKFDVALEQEPELLPH